MSDDLTRELRAALSDLERHAPDAPKLRDIIAGGPVLLTSQSLPSWRRRVPGPVVLVAAAAVTIIVLGIVALIAPRGGDNPTPPAGGEEPDIYGIWLVDTVTTGTETATIDPENFDRRPYLEVTHEGIAGWTGCNAIEHQEPPVLTGNRLRLGEIIMTAVGCELDVEPALLAVLTSDSIVETDTLSMTWTASGVTVRFIRSESPPGATIPEWETNNELLDCTPRQIMTVDIPAEEQDARPVLAAFEGVVTIEGDGLLGGESPWAYGLDADGEVVAVAAPGDVLPPVVHLSACADRFGIRDGTDLSNSVRTWVNMLGLGQVSRQVWDNRFAEICAAAQSDLPTLVQPYLAEDAPTTLREGGGLPSPDETVAALEVLWLSTCAAGDRLASSP